MAAAHRVVVALGPPRGRVLRLALVLHCHAHRGVDKGGEHRELHDKCSNDVDHEEHLARGGRGRDIAVADGGERDDREVEGVAERHAVAVEQVLPE